jgi:hypothetical protein
MNSDGSPASGSTRRGAASAVMAAFPAQSSSILRCGTPAALATL